MHALVAVLDLTSGTQRPVIGAAIGGSGGIPKVAILSVVSTATDVESRTTDFSTVSGGDRCGEASALMGSDHETSTA